MNIRIERSWVSRPQPPVKSPLVTGVVLAVMVLLPAGCGEGARLPGSPKAYGLPRATTLPPPVASPLPVVLIYEEQFEEEKPARDKVDAAVWGDGRMVWRAAGHLLQSRVDPAKVDQLLRALHRDDVFGDGKARYDSFGPHADYEVIAVRLADRHLTLTSWHDLFEANPNFVVTTHGVGSLEGQPRQVVLAPEPPEYLRFRQVWSDIRSAVRTWVPPAGEPYLGEVLGVPSC